MVIADRYIHSNIAYQCAKLNLKTEKEILRKWILKTEYSHYMIPVPDLSLFLHVPIEFVVNNIYSDREGNDRKYLDGNKDIHEVNINLQRAVEIEYINLTETMGGFHLVKCYNDKNEILSENEILNLIVGELDCRGYF